jgi:hypothetical protein
MFRKALLTAVSLLASPGLIIAQPPTHTWEPFQPLTVDTRPALRSAPAAAGWANGSAVAVWVDGRSVLPDIYGAYWQDGQPIQEFRAAHRTPRFDPPALRTPGVALEASRVFVAWADEARIRITRGDLSISPTRWTSPTVVVSFNQWEAVAIQPVLASDGSGNLVVAWTDFRDNSSHGRQGDIYAAQCDGNATPIACRASVKVNSDADPIHPQRKPAIARRGNNVVIAWEDGREQGPNFPRIYASVSTNGGATWEPDLRVSRRLDGSAPGLRESATAPSVAYDSSGRIWFAWEHRSGSPTAQTDIFVTWWDGTSWDGPWRVDNGPRRTRSLAPSIAIAGDIPIVVWQDHRNGQANADLYAAIWRWDTNKWYQHELVLAHGAQTAPSIVAVDGQRAFLAWRDERAGYPEIYGGFWQLSSLAAGLNSKGLTAQRLHGAPPRLPYQMTPALAARGGRTYAMFADRQTGYQDFYLAQRTLSGTWQAPSPLPTGADKGVLIHHEATNLALGLDGRLHAVWSDAHWSRGRRVRYASFDGQRWSEPVFIGRVLTSTNDQRLPSFAIYGSTMVASWSNRDPDTKQLQLYASWNAGAGWVTETAVLTQTWEAWGWDSTVATDGQLIYVAWHRDETNGRGRILLARRPMTPDGDWTYSQVNPFHTDDWCYHRSPQLGVDAGGTLHIVWVGCARRDPHQSRPRDYYLYYARSTDQGTTWSAPLRVAMVSPDRFRDLYPAMAVAPDGKVMAVYPVRDSADVYRQQAALIENGAVVLTQTLSMGSGWVTSGNYEGEYYGGDSAGSVAYDPVAGRFVIALVDRSNGYSPRIFTTALNLFMPRTFLPVVLNEP